MAKKTTEKKAAPKRATKATKQAALIKKHSRKDENGCIDCDLIWIDGQLCDKATNLPV